MKPRIARWLALTMLVAYVVLVSATFVFQAFTPESYRDGELISDIALSISMGFVALIGALIASRLPSNPIGWIILAVESLVAALSLFTQAYVVYDIQIGVGSLPGVDLALFWQSSELSRIAILGLTLMFLWFPTGREYTPGWRKLIWLATLSFLIYVPLAAIEPGPIEDFPSITNPLAIDRVVWRTLAPIKLTADILTGLCFLAAGASLILRLRGSTGVERQQLKWFVFAASFFPFAYLMQVFGDPALRQLGEWLQFIPIVGMPIAVAIAMLRHRLFDIDVIIHRTLVYGALSSSLLLMYLMSVFVLQSFFRPMTNQESPVVVIVATLSVVGIIRPLHRRIQRFIDRRFFRKKFNASQVLREFSDRMRDETRFDDITGALLSAVRDTVQPEHASLWLRGESSTEG